MLLTTSRKAGQRTIQLAKELAGVLNLTFLRRGEKTIDDLVKKARKEGFQKIFLITEKNGNPNQIQSIQLNEKNWGWEKTLVIKKIKLQKDFNKKYSAQELTCEPGSIQNFFGIETEESDLTLKETNTSFSFFVGEEEVGPKIFFEVLE